MFGFVCPYPKPVFVSVFLISAVGIYAFLSFRDSETHMYMIAASPSCCFHGLYSQTHALISLVCDLFDVGDFFWACSSLFTYSVEVPKQFRPYQQDFRTRPPDPEDSRFRYATCKYWQLRLASAMFPSGYTNPGLHDSSDVKNCRPSSV